jgi:hypothetical protein
MCLRQQVEQQRFLVQPFSILTNNHAVRASNPMAASASADDSAAGDADEAAALREGYSQHLRQQQLMRQRRRQLQLQLQQQQQQQQAAYMHAQAGHMPFGPQLFAADEAARLAVHGYWGSGATTSGQAGVLRASAGMYGPQGTSVGLLSSDSSMAWAYKGANGMGPAGHQGSFSQQQQQQQQDLLLQRSDSAGVQVKRSSSQSRQQGRLGRMASRIYSLRPRLRKADSGTAERAAPAVSQQAAAAAAAGLYSQFSASFKHGLSVLSAGDNAAASAAAAASGTAVPASQGAGAAAAATAEAGSAETASAAAAAPAAEAAGAAALQQLDLGDAKAVLSALGLPADTAVVGPQYYAGGPHGPVAKFSTLNPRCAPGCIALFLCMVCFVVLIVCRTLPVVLGTCVDSMLEELALWKRR